MKYNLNNLTAWIDISTYCNARCPQCHRNDPDGLKKASWLPLVQWSLEQFKNAYPPSTLQNIKKFEICGTWGDPIMNKDIYEIVEYLIKNSQAWIQINTNGGMRDEVFWWKLGVIGRRRMQVIFDIDGINQEMHAKYRRNVDFEKLKQNVIAYIEGGGNAFAHIIVFKHNEKYLKDIVEMVREWGIPQYLAQASNRFDNGPIFKFRDEQGQLQTLEERVDKNNPFITNIGIAPLRDYNWWKNTGVKNQMNNHKPDN